MMGVTVKLHWVLVILTYCLGTLAAAETKSSVDSRVTHGAQSLPKGKNNSTSGAGSSSLVVVDTGDQTNNITLLGDSEKKMPNIGYVLSGYDIYFGNPMPTGESGAISDPGYREQIFESKYSGLTTPDGRYFVPNGIEIRSCQGTCNLNFKSTLMSGAKSYQKSLNVRASVSGGYMGASFSASAGYKHVEKNTKFGKNLFTQSDASCCAYEATIEGYTPPNFTRNFLAGLKSLTEKYDAAVYREFINNFGTHYLRSGYMGALFGQQSQISSQSWSKMVQNGVDIGVSASYSGLSVSAAVSLETQTQKTAAENFKKETTEQKIYSHGAPPPADGKSNTWMQHTIDDPAPMSIKLAPFDQLPIKKIVSSVVVSNMKQAIKDYCKALNAEGKVSSCTGPDSDHPFPRPPKKRTWKEWSNVEKGGELMPPQECPEGSYVTAMRWYVRPHRSKSLVGMEFKCLLKPGESDDYIDAGGWSSYGTADPPMNCGKAGFRQVTGREEYHYGMINVRAFCSNSEIEIRSNNNMNAGYNHPQICSLGQKVVGIQIRRQEWREHLYGIVNFRIVCA